MHDGQFDEAMARALAGEQVILRDSRGKPQIIIGPDVEQFEDSEEEQEEEFDPTLPRRPFTWFD